MAKLILLSVILFTTIVPVTVAGRLAPRRSLRTVQLLTLVVVFLWALACRQCYPALVPVEY